MKYLRSLLFVFYLCVLSTNIFADEIFLDNGKVLKVKVVQIDEKRVKYRYKKYSRLRSIARSRVVKVVYSGNHTVILNRNYSATDKIYLKDLSIKYGKILQVSENNIEYDPAGKHPFDVCVKKDVIKIVYKNGKEVHFTPNKPEYELSGNKENIDDEKDSSWYIGFSLSFISGGATVRGIGKVDGSAPSATDQVFLIGSLSSNIGYIINSKFRLGLDYTAVLGDVFFDDVYDKEEYEYEDEWTFSMHTFSGVLYYSPGGSTGIFSRIAVGYTQIRLENKEIDLMEEANGIAFAVGIGYDWRITGNFHITANIDYFNNNYFDDPVFSRAQGILAYCTFYWR